MEGDAKIFWSRLKDSTVDLIFEELQKSLLVLKQKIKDGTATEEECCQALTLLNFLDANELLQLINVTEEDKVTDEQGLHSSASGEIEESNRDITSLETKPTEVKHSRSKGERREKSSKFHYQDHICSRDCLIKRPWNSYKNENPLNLPLLWLFQRWHAKANSLSKLHDVVYKAPCGRSLRNFKEVQKYLFQTECNFLFLDHFSFNTYVQVFRNNPSRQKFIFDFDISKGAEAVPVSLCNEIDHEKLPCFKYRKASWPHGCFLNNFTPMVTDSCSCTDGCADRTKCACLLLTERSCHEASVSSGKESIGYKYKRLDGPISSGIYECNLLCSCDKSMCQNRVIQHGLQVRLQVFKTEKKGWGVRCLDDIDKGTFVCTYAGRLMLRGKSQEVRDGGSEAEEEDTTNNDGNNILSKKRKAENMCSDSEIEFVQTTDRQKCLHVKPEDEPNLTQNYSNNKSWNSPAVSRPKSRTSVLQSHRRQLGIADASSDDDESSMCQKTPGGRVTTVVKKAAENSSILEEVGGLASTVQSEVNTDCQTENPLPSSPLGQDEKEGKHLLGTDKPLNRMIGRGRQEPTYNKKAVEDNEASLGDKENPYLLDATREGNVGRFLNHSCSPNLFVQSVFIETHNRSFPSVAFFTNRHVKAGTELTWDYGYEAGSRPEDEIDCHCGTHKCRGKIL